MKKAVIFGIGCMLAAVCAVYAADSGIKGWILAGSKPKSYTATLDPANARGSHRTVLYKSVEEVKDGFGTMMQMIKADKYKGKRVRLSAYLKAEDVKGSAVLWMRVDGSNPGNVLAFDNMNDRAIKGTLDWKKYSVVLDVPAKDSNMVAFGFIIAGSGKLWVSEMAFETVDKSVPVTAKGMETPAQPDEPVNLDFN